MGVLGKRFLNLILGPLNVYFFWEVGFKPFLALIRAFWGFTPFERGFTQGFSKNFLRFIAFNWPSRFNPFLWAKPRFFFFGFLGPSFFFSFRGDYPFFTGRSLKFFNTGSHRPRGPHLGSLNSATLFPRRGLLGSGGGHRERNGA